MDRLGDSDKRSISRPNSPGQISRPTPPFSQSPLYSSFSLFSRSSFFLSNLCSLQTDKGSLRIHFVCMSACKCVSACVSVCLSSQLISHEGQLPQVPLKSFQRLSLIHSRTHANTHTGLIRVFHQHVGDRWPVYRALVLLVQSFCPMLLFCSNLCIQRRHALPPPPHPSPPSASE